MYRLYVQGCPYLLAQLFNGVREEFFVFGEIPRVTEAVEHMEVFVVTTFERIADTSFDTGVGAAIALREFIVERCDLFTNNLRLVKQNTNAGTHVSITFTVYIEAEAVQECRDFFGFRIQGINLSAGVFADDRIVG